MIVLDKASQTANYGSVDERFGYFEDDYNTKTPHHNFVVELKIRRRDEVHIEI